VPLLLVKLWTVYPLLFRRPPRELRRLVLEGLERASIAVLVASAIFQLATGTLNSAQWYPWAFSFRASHYAVAWVAMGALALHVAVKLPIIRRALTSDVESTVDDRPSATRPGVLSRRGLLRTTFLASGVAALAVAGGAVPLLRKVSVFAVRSGDGPQGVPVNKSAAAAHITDDMVGPAYRLEVVYGERRASFTREDLHEMTQRTESLPIACVEGWSAGALWTGVRVRDLLDLVGVPAGRDVDVYSLQPSGPYTHTVLQGNFADDDRTLVALALHGEPLDRDHGEPARLIAPDRPGVLQTKWLSRLEVAV
jgi:DMSO/TMAO reductase YedYZ molybdopterin-dependent catalytic subunit